MCKGGGGGYNVRYIHVFDTPSYHPCSGQPIRKHYHSKYSPIHNLSEFRQGDLGNIVGIA